MISFIALFKLKYVNSHVYKLFWLKYTFSKSYLNCYFLSCVLSYFEENIISSY